MPSRNEIIVLAITHPAERTHADDVCARGDRAPSAAKRIRERPRQSGGAAQRSRETAQIGKTEGRAEGRRAPIDRQTFLVHIPKLKQ